MEQTTIRQPTLLGRAFRLYYEGFRNMTLGRTLWKIIILKLIIMFAVLKLFFFPDFLDTHFSTDKQKADYVLEQITLPTKENNTLTGGKRL